MIVKNKLKTIIYKGIKRKTFIIILIKILKYLY